MGRVLGIDVGSKTLGLALSDETGVVSMPLRTLVRRGMRHDMSQIGEISREGGVTEIVIGLPLNLDGSPGAMADEVRQVSEAVARECGVPVHFQDERMTTAAAERVLIQADVSRKKRRKVIDKLAATLILQSYLDRRSATDEDRRAGTLPPNS